MDPAEARLPACIVDKRLNMFILCNELRINLVEEPATNLII